MLIVLLVLTALMYIVIGSFPIGLAVAVILWGIAMGFKALFKV